MVLVVMPPGAGPGGVVVMEALSIERFKLSTRAVCAVVSSTAIVGSWKAGKVDC